MGLLEFLSGTGKEDQELRRKGILKKSVGGEYIDIHALAKDTAERITRSSQNGARAQDRGWLPRRGPGVKDGRGGVVFYRGTPGVRSRFLREEPSAKPVERHGASSTSQRTAFPQRGIRDPRRIGPVSVNPHGVPAVPAERGNSYTGRGWNRPNEPLAPRGQQAIYDVRDVNAPRGAAKFGDPNSRGGRNLTGPRDRFFGHGPRPQAVLRNQ